MLSTVAKRYSRALFEAAGTNADSMLSELQTVSQFLNSNADVFSALTNPSLSKAQRLVMVDAIAKSSTGMSAMVGNALKVLAEKNRFDSLGDIVSGLRDLVDAKANRVRGQVSSATPLQADQIQSIQKTLEGITKKNVVLDAKVDPSLLGGIVAQVGSETFDGSLKNQLKELERTLLQPVR